MQTQIISVQKSTRFKGIPEYLEGQSLAFTSRRNRGRKRGWPFDSYPPIFYHHFQRVFKFENTLINLRKLLTECLVILFFSSFGNVFTKHTHALFPKLLPLFTKWRFQCAWAFNRVRINIADLKMMGDSHPMWRYLTSAKKGIGFLFLFFLVCGF